MMNKLFKPVSLLMYLLVVLVFFIAGMTIAGISGVAEGAGLAGGAIVLFYGLIAAILAFILALFVAHKTQIETIIKINKIFGILFFLAACLFVYRVITLNKNKIPVNEYPKEITAPVATDKEISMVSYKELKRVEKLVLMNQNSKLKMGIGLFKPNYFEYPTLYFFGGVNLEKGLTEHMPMDSLVFAGDEYNEPTTTYAPPWLYPEHLKLDYGIIIFKALGIGYDFVKVEANKQTKQLTYLDKNKGTFMTWPEFLLSINSVEFIEKSKQTIHIKPLDYAGEVNVKYYAFMQPLLVEQDWMYVKLVDENLKEQGKGWIRWKKDNVLLIIYSLLS